MYIHCTEDQSSHCSVSNDSYLKDKVDELDQKVEGIFNQTQGNYTIMFMHMNMHNEPDSLKLS